MSEFRIFCIGMFASGGITAGFSNHVEKLSDGKLLVAMLFFGAVAVVIFGKRKPIE